jgi:molybdopterin-binding protein
MTISARNQLKGKIAAASAGATTSHVSIDIRQGSILTASITNEAVAESWSQGRR